MVLTFIDQDTPLVLRHRSMVCMEHETPSTMNLPLKPMDSFQSIIGLAMVPVHIDRQPPMVLND